MYNRFSGIKLWSNKKIRSSRPEEFCKKGIFKSFTKFTENICARVSFNKVAGLRPATFLKERIWHSCFPVNFAKFLRTPFLQNTSGGCFWKILKIRCQNIYMWKWSLSLRHRKKLNIFTPQLLIYWCKCQKQSLEVFCEKSVS